jgi:N-acylglucosamine 2-epimerase
MDIKAIKNYKEIYRAALLDDAVPFWQKRALDLEYGGYLHCFDRKGELIGTDKSVWTQGRILWMFSILNNLIEKRQDWVSAAKLGYDFINKYCFDENMHMYFRVTREGKPLRIRRYWYSEAFAIEGFIEYAKASGDNEALKKAKEIYNRVMMYFNTPGYFPPKVNPETRKTKSHSIYMILLTISRKMKEVDDDPIYDKMIDMCLNEIMNNFVKREEKALFETVGINGERLNSPEGRCINPGHAIESSWFIMKEAISRKDNALMKSAIEIMEWSLEKGWDKKFGGLFYFIDVEGKPSFQLEWDMKLAWPHNEALYALLLAYHYTKNDKYFNLFEKIHIYAFEHFRDIEYGEWFGYLHRDGTPITEAKGTDWKSPYHLVRSLLYIYILLDDMEKGKQI